jgi:hypothetical protein
LEVASDKNSEELENTTGELTEQKEISIEPNNTRELQIDERTYEQDQLVREKATEIDGLKIASIDNETETEKPEIGGASSYGEEEDSVKPQDENVSGLEMKPEGETEAESLANEEITQTIEADGPCITQDKAEVNKLFHLLQITCISQF